MRTTEWTVTRGVRDLALAVMVASALLGGCRSVPTPPETRPHESLMTILAELQLHRGEDVYRFGYPADVTGQNVFRASLIRLVNWEQQRPGQWEDIVRYAKGLAFEALGEFEEAAAQFGRVAVLDTELSEAAAERLQVDLRLAELANFEPEGETLALFLLSMAENVDRWRREAALREGTEWEAVARHGWEQAEMRQAEILREVRFSIERGDERYREACQQLIEHHADSHRVHQHWLRLGDHHRDLAERLAVFSPPSQTAFDIDTFEQLVGAARTIYLQVERADGFREKLEARARLAALEQFAQRVREDAR